jgi:hypothetical protein
MPAHQPAVMCACCAPQWAAAPNIIGQELQVSRLPAAVWWRAGRCPAQPPCDNRRCTARPLATIIAPPLRPAEGDRAAEGGQGPCLRGAPVSATPAPAAAAWPAAPSSCGLASSPPARPHPACATRPPAQTRQHDPMQQMQRNVAGPPHDRSPAAARLPGWVPGGRGLPTQGFQRCCQCPQGGGALADEPGRPGVPDVRGQQRHVPGHPGGRVCPLQPAPHKYMSTLVALLPTSPRTPASWATRRRRCPPDACPPPDAGHRILLVTCSQQGILTAPLSICAAGHVPGPPRLGRHNSCARRREGPARVPQGACSVPKLSFLPSHEWKLPGNCEGLGLGRAGALQGRQAGSCMTHSCLHPLARCTPAPPTAGCCCQLTCPPAALL